jgi:biofilm protein TabA
MNRRDIFKTAAAGLPVTTGWLALAKPGKVMQGKISKWHSMPQLKGLEPAFQFLERSDLATLKEGRYPLVGEDVYAMITVAKTRAPEGRKFETHRKYIDVHALLSGQETIGSAPAASLKVTDPYDAAKEAELFAIPASYDKLEMHPGLFAVFQPGEAHLPGCDLDGPHETRKVVVKVAVSYRMSHGGK